MEDVVLTRALRMVAPLGLAGCLAAPDHAGTMYRCDVDPACPDGFACVDGVCTTPPGDGIPAGTFEMGCMTGMANCDPDAMPEHAVTLAAFALDATEVSQRDYKACVDAGGCCASTTSDCPAPVQLDADLDLPMRDLTWGAAREYCSFAGKHLPTEAQWERAARMGDHPYPWGDDAADCSRAIGAGCNGPRDVTDGAGPPFDLLGNVAEWVQDEYNATFYTTSPATNPLDDAGGNIRVIRGGGFTTAATDFAVWRRDHDDRYHHADDLGFRCAR